MTERSPGISSMCPASRSISTRSTSASWWISAIAKLAFTIGKAGILWKLDRKTGEFLDAKETLFQNVFTWLDRKKGRSPTGPTSSRTRPPAVDPVLPQHGGRP